MSEQAPAGRRAGRYDPDDPSLPQDQPRRHAALSAAASGIRVRAGKLSVEQILLIGACVLFPLGLVFILLGWYGAAHTGRTYAQIDYLISGGLLGVGISVAGGFMYFGYWLSRQLGESRRQNALTLQALRRLEDAISAQSGNGATGWPSYGNGAGAGRTGAELDRPAQRGRSRDGTPGSARAGAGGRASADEPTGEVPLPTLVATAKGSLLHLPDCPVVANKSTVKPVPAGTEGYGYCTMCDAAAALASSPRGTTPGG